MKYIKSFNEGRNVPLPPSGLNYYLDEVSDDIMDRLSDCLLEVFDHFNIPMTTTGKFPEIDIDYDFKWFNDDNVDITIGGIPTLGLCYEIMDYIKSKKDMITNRFGYDIKITSGQSLSSLGNWVAIRPLVPKSKKFNEGRKSVTTPIPNPYTDYVSEEIMDRLSDCLLEVFDHFNIPMTTTGKFPEGVENREFRWWNDCNHHITIGNIPYLDSNKLLYDIVSYIRSKKNMITNRFGYDIRLDYNGKINNNWISIRPLVPVGS